MKKVFFFMGCLLLLTGCSRLHYQKTDMKLGDYEVYKSYYNNSNSICKTASRELISEDDTHNYYIRYTGCDLELGYYIKDDNKFLKLPEALEKKLITFDEIKLLDIYFKEVKKT